MGLDTGCGRSPASRPSAVRRAERNKCLTARDPRQLTIGQLMLMVALWALGVAAWRLAW